MRAILKKTLALSLLCGVIYSCSEEFLMVPPEDSLTDASFYTNDAQLMAATSTLYNLVWFDYNDKASYNIGDFRGGTTLDAWNDRDNVEFKTTASTIDNGVAWRAFFNVIGQANTTMLNIRQSESSELSEEVRRTAIAECRFMRAVAYEHLVMNWGPVPIITNNIDLLEDPLSVRRHTVESVWRFITQDYLAAARDLPESRTQEGRVTSWSAEGMLSRTYLTRAGVAGAGGNRDQTYLDSAKYYAQRVIESSGASLLPDYADLFTVPYDNNAESLFSLQWAFASGEWGSNNSVPAYLTPTGALGNGDGWGGAKGATFWLLSLYEGFEQIDDITLQGRTVDSRLHATFMLPGGYYPELPYADANGDLAVGYTVPEPGGDLATTVDFAAYKKYVVGRLSPTEAISQHYSHDTYMLRLAEVYLNYVDAAIGNDDATTDPMALDYFNAVHERATGQTVEDEVSEMDLLEERAKEFAGESRFWYDLVRIHYYDPEFAYEVIGNQDRGLYSIEPDNPTDPTQWTIQHISWDANRFFNASSANFRLPLPINEISSAPNLLEEPVDYEF
ncbi:RagB/SusD family nutrient uptake outer membrane protein [Lewinella sp. IMCC34191]|uniref:RagB/SusD family nutrient uptake outer membrane protein n=1 Tax=Lewinella sp. IMCC34191 TaxID=2259172 RepID=UPI000E2367BE|nr:RagB/SusD family nutrient uptake outer membrane protein [Lewinella sp. IMCC34191]